MNICQFCHRSFKNRQGFVAHSKSCSKYQKAKAQQKAPNSSIGKELQRDGLGTDSSKRAAQQPHADDPMAAFKALLGESGHSSIGDRSASVASRRRLLLQRAKQQAIDAYIASEGNVTPVMRGEAHKAIEIELSQYPLEEFSSSEILERTMAIRDKVYAPYFRQEREERERQAMQDRERLEQIIRERRTAEKHECRKTLWMELARHKIVAGCQRRGLPTGAKLSLELVIEQRVQMTLAGTESEQEAEEVIEFVINQHFQVLDEQKSARVAQKRQQLIDQVGDVAIGLTPLAMGLAKPFLQKGMAWVAGKVGVSTPPSPNVASQEHSTQNEHTGQSQSPSNDQSGTNGYPDSSHFKPTGASQNRVSPRKGNPPPLSGNR